MTATTLPYQTADVAGVGGRLRERAEDFFVQELPLYPPGGTGGHVFFEVQKVGITTRQAVERVARALGVDRRDVGYAGQKDRHAVSRQVFSVPLSETVTEDRVMRMEADGVVPQWADLHENKIKPGHLAGNRFALRVRGVRATDVVRLRPVLDRLERDGVPNYYGEQRFGVDPHRPSDALGMCLVRGDSDGFLRLYLGGADARDDLAAARALFDAGDAAGALEAWPHNVRDERAVLSRYVRTHDAAPAVKALDKRLLSLLRSAAQSRVFNEVVADRVRDGLLSRLVPGDAARLLKDNNLPGGGFTVEDASAEQHRCEAWQISPTGPMPGRKARPRPASEAEAREAAAMTRLGVTADDFRHETGERRPLRVRPVETQLSGGVDEHGEHITVAFTLPAGSFATVLMRELMKNDEEGQSGVAS